MDDIAMFHDNIPPKKYIGSDLSKTTKAIAKWGIMFRISLNVEGISAGMRKPA